MAKRQEKQDLRQPDEFVGFFGRMMGALAAHPREVLAAIALALVVGFGLVGYSDYQAKINGAAADDFEKIMARYPEAETLPPPGETESKEPTKLSWKDLDAELTSFLAEHGSSSLGPIANLYRAKALMRLKEYAQALSLFQDLAGDLAGPYYYLAKDGEAAALMELKKWDEAERLLTELSQDEKNPMRAVHFWQLGLAQEGATHTPQAVATYRDFETKFPDSPLIEKVRLRLAYLQSVPATP